MKDEQLQCRECKRRCCRACGRRHPEPMKRVVSDETRAKISQSMKDNWARWHKWQEAHYARLRAEDQAKAELRRRTITAWAIVMKRIYGKGRPR